MHKAIIFDMDGVLVDSQAFHFATDMITLQQNGYPEATLEDVKPFAGMSSIDLWEKYIELFGLKESAPFLVEAHDVVRMDMLKTTEFEPVAGIPELLKMLSGIDIRLAVASSSRYVFINHILEKLGIKDYFEVVMSSQHLEHCKPHPEVFLKTAEELGLKPEECIVIEDSGNGVKAAYNAGMKCIAYRSEATGEQDLSKATVIIDSFHELLNDKAWLE